MCWEVGTSLGDVGSRASSPALIAAPFSSRESFLAAIDAAKSHSSAGIRGASFFLQPNPGPLSPEPLITDASQEPLKPGASPLHGQIARGATRETEA